MCTVAPWRGLPSVKRHGVLLLTTQYNTIEEHNPKGNRTELLWRDITAQISQCGPCAIQITPGAVMQAHGDLSYILSSRIVVPTLAVLTPNSKSSLKVKDYFIGTGFLIQPGYFIRRRKNTLKRQLKTH